MDEVEQSIRDKSPQGNIIGDLVYGTYILYYRILK